MEQFAVKLKRVNESQRSLMATKKAIAEDAKNVFNNLLLNILDISKCALEYYENDPEKAKLFDYTYIIQNQVVSSVN